MAKGFNPNAWYDFCGAAVPANPEPAPNGTKDKAIDMSDMLAVLL